MASALPHTLSMGITGGANANNSKFLVGGGIVYAVGLLFESLGDYQKWSFKQSHKGQFCNVGLWSLSQHPNWFGNLTLWIGILIMNAPALLQVTTATSSTATTTSITGKITSLLKPIVKHWRFGLALLGPIFLWSLFLRAGDGQSDGFGCQGVRTVRVRHRRGIYELYRHDAVTHP